MENSSSPTRVGRVDQDSIGKELIMEPEPHLRYTSFAWGATCKRDPRSSSYLHTESEPSASLARSKRGSPSDVSDESNEDGFQTISHQRKKKSSTRTTLCSQSSSLMPIGAAVTTEANKRLRNPAVIPASSDLSGIDTSSIAPAAWAASTSYALP